MKKIMPYILIALVIGLSFQYPIVAILCIDLSVICCLICGVRKLYIKLGGKKIPRIYKFAAGAAVLLLYILAVILPYVWQPGVQASTKEEQKLSEFYSEDASGERAKVISGNGEALEERIRLISQAKEEIILSTFEFDADTSGKMMMAALADAGRRGVRVSILTDGFPYITAMWGNPYFLALARMENVEIRVYNPVSLWKPWTFMGRMHDKYLLVDDFAYILGGRNTYDYFLGDQPGYKNYDWDVLVYCADAANPSINQVKKYFNSVWEMPESHTLGKYSFWGWNPAVKRAENEIQKQYITMKEEQGSWFQEKDYTEMTVPVNNIQLVSNPTQTASKEPVVFYCITELMKQAEKEVVFHTPYIICDDWMLGRLREVCEQVDEVWMMTNSVANNGNPFGAMDYQRYKEEILDTGVQIMEYDKGVSYHGKCFTIDDRISGIGSFNWDMRSAYLDTEVMLVIDSRELNEQLRSEMTKYEDDALKVVDEERYELPDGTLPRELSEKKKFRIMVLGAIAGWARFLM